MNSEINSSNAKNLIAVTILNILYWFIQNADLVLKWAVGITTVAAATAAFISHIYTIIEKRERRKREKLNI